MYISEALVKAQEQNCALTRKKWENYFFIYQRPDCLLYRCDIRLPFYENKYSFTWTIDSLLADDWELTTLATYYYTERLK